MEGGTPEGGFKAVVEEEGRLLHMQLRGYWSLQTAQDYAVYVRGLFERFQPEYKALVDVRQSPIQSTEVAKLRSELIHEAIARGLTRVAYVTENTLAKMQMRRIALQGGCREVECFVDEEQARAWLARPL
jgi:hypothetical protein